LRGRYLRHLARDSRYALNLVVVGIFTGVRMMGESESKPDSKDGEVTIKAPCVAASFTSGKRYTRQEIHDAVGGNMRSYLPHVGGRIVAACLRLDIDPDAPLVILAGTGKGIEAAADLLARQQEAVPTFLKRGSGRWEYVGDFMRGRCSTDPEEIAGHARRSG